MITSPLKPISQVDYILLNSETHRMVSSWLVGYLLNEPEKLALQTASFTPCLVCTDCPVEFLLCWPIQCISRKISLDFSFWFLMRISRILYLAYEGVLLFHCLFFHKLFKESIVSQESRMIPMWFWDLVGITVLVRITVSLLEVRGEVCLHARVLLLRIA